MKVRTRIQELFEAFGILLLALVIAISFITMPRMCEARNQFDGDGNPLKIPCAEVIDYEK